VARWYFPPEVDYRLSLLHPDAKGLVVWIMEAKVQWLLALTSIDRDFFTECSVLEPLLLASDMYAGSVQGRAAVPGHAPRHPPQSQGDRRSQQLVHAFLLSPILHVQFPTTREHLWLNYYYMILLDACRRSFVWKPLKQIAGLEPNPDAEE